jgi:hypothetical protein
VAVFYSATVSNPSGCLRWSAFFQKVPWEKKNSMIVFTMSDIRISHSAAYCLTVPPAEVGKVTWKSNGDKALNDKFLLKSNDDEA